MCRTTIGDRTAEFKSAACGMGKVLRRLPIGVLALRLTVHSASQRAAWSSLQAAITSHHPVPEQELPSLTNTEGSRNRRPNALITPHGPRAFLLLNFLATPTDTLRTQTIRHHGRRYRLPCHRLDQHDAPT